MICYGVEYEDQYEPENGLRKIESLNSKHDIRHLSSNFCFLTPETFFIPDLFLTEEVKPQGLIQRLGWAEFHSDIRTT